MRLHGVGGVSGAGSSTAALPYTPQPFQCGRLHGVAHPRLIEFFQALPRIGQLPVEPDTTVYLQRPNLVRDIALPAEIAVPWPRLVAKQFGWRGGQHYFFSPLKRSRALKAYRTACYLLAHQLKTPLPLGVFEERRWGFVQYNVYATEAITDYLTLRQYRHTLPDGPQGMPEVMRLAADYTRHMHDSGLWHRDMVLSNFLLAGPPGKRTLYLIDLNRAYRLPYLPMLVRAVEIARMDWQEWYPQFVAFYCADRFNVQRMLRIVALYRRWRTVRRRVLNVLKPIRRCLGI